jgi:hypothetical protein
LRTRWLLALLLSIVLVGSQLVAALADGIEGGDPHGHGHGHQDHGHDRPGDA